MKILMFKPSDILFFRGPESAQMGSDHSVSSIFPPPISTIQGAIRTAILKQNNIDLDDYKKNNVNPDILEVLGPAGGEAGFQVSGPALIYKEKRFIPAPYHWFTEKKYLENSQSTDEMPMSGMKVKLFIAREVREDIIKSDRAPLPWAKSDGDELVSLGGLWIEDKTIQNPGEIITVYSKSCFYEQEERTGIALDKNTRTVRMGHLYTFPYVRLKEDVLLEFYISREIPLEKEGILFLGGDRRFGRYILKDNGHPVQGSGELFMALNPIEVTSELAETVFATGKIEYIGGWDLHKQFHKPLKPFYPAGTVFKNKLDNSWIQL